MKNRHILFGYVLAFTLIFAGMSCTKGGLGTSRLKLYLTDAPAAFDAVNIEILRIEIKSTNDFGDDSWQVLRFNNPGIYNLLDYCNGLDTLLSSTDLPPGKLSQIRLMLGSNNSIVVNGSQMELPLSTPSMQQTGLKLNVHADLLEGVEYKLWVDFDAARSIVLTGNGQYKLKPVLRTFTKEETGAIQGIVNPREAEATVFAISGPDTLAAIPNNTPGHFLIRGLAPGIWKILADGNNNYKDQSIENVQVKVGEITTTNPFTLVQ
jgi:hypothetical protein